MIMLQINEERLVKLVVAPMVSCFIEWQTKKINIMLHYVSGTFGAGSC